MDTYEGGHVVDVVMRRGGVKWRERGHVSWKCVGILEEVSGCELHV